MISPSYNSHNSSTNELSYSFLLSDDDDNENVDEPLNRSRHSIASNRSRLSVNSVGSQHSIGSTWSRASGHGNKSRSSPYQRPKLSDLTREAAFFEALPKNIFQMPGSFTLWTKLIGAKPLTGTQVESLKNKIKNYSEAEKYAFARLVVYGGFEAALRLNPVVKTADTIVIEHLSDYRPRRFADASTQVDDLLP